ncbi:exported protein (partial) [Bordetella ansorpii]|uniref:Exported protein (Partial) n=1 Tax=Bordetella ansorpii TaxID=288768 RepID=A0A157NRZ6_9BORD|nr:hypothetical protein [Bordetella ansorpii]SAI23806.1 exported protein (partial) [Bordetella ansorpii]
MKTLFPTMRVRMKHAAFGLAMLAACLAAALPLSAQARPDASVTLSPAQQYGMALEAQTEEDYPALLRWLRASAGAGHLPAQEMLGVVLLGGPSLYGQKIATDPCEARYWLRQAAANGGSASLPRALAGRPHGQGGVVCP